MRHPPRLPFALGVAIAVGFTLAACKRVPIESPATPDRSPTTPTASAAPDRSDAAGPADPAAPFRDLLVIDSHVDLPYRLDHDPADIGRRLPEGHFDLVRARAGGLDASFWAIYVGSEFNRPGTSEKAKGGAWAEAQRLLTLVDETVAAHPKRIARVNRADELERAAAAGRHAVALGLENGAPIEGDLDKLRRLYDAGIRYVTLTHADDNHICDSSFDDRHTHGGLTAFGKRLIPAMNRLGMMIDVSHVSDDAFWQILELSQSPVIASHSGLRRFHDMERNVSDEMLRALAAKGGVLQLNFGSYFLSETAAAEMRRLEREIDAARAAAPTPEEGERRAEALEAAFEGNPLTLDDFVTQLDYAVKLVGADHVGLGSDFDGVYFLPAGLEDVSAYPRLFTALRARGYTREQLAQIAGGNLLRVWRANERIAAELSAAKRP